MKREIEGQGIAADMIRGRLKVKDQPEPKKQVISLLDEEGKIVAFFQEKGKK